MTRLKYHILLAGLISIFLAFASCKEKSANTPNNIESSTAAVDNSEYLYGINIDSLTVTKQTIKRNAFLADMLQNQFIDYNTVLDITDKSKGVFDFRTIRAGKNFFYLHDKKCASDCKYVIYEKSIAEYVVCDLTDSVEVYIGKKPIRKETNTASGVINSSLYLTLEENDLHPTLALSLADIYAWTVDFYHLQKGDKFKVIYEEEFVDSISLGVSDIKAVLFDHFGKEIYANQYTLAGDSIPSYYDFDGGSLQKTFLKSPLKFGRKTSSFSWSRKHPVTGRRKGHFGTDYAAPTGTPIRSTADGVIVEARYKKYNGNYVKVKHNSTYMTQYLHMSKFAAGIKPGTHVKQGQTIGYVGSTGLATGPHVCYRFWKHGTQIDHTKEDIPPSEPIPSEHLANYLVHFDSVKLLLDNIEYPTKEVEITKLADNKNDEKEQNK